MSSNPDLRQRFEREAKAVSSLQHPNICVLHDVGHQDGAEGTLDFLVMEYLEGESLSDRIVKGPLPAHLALRYGMQIADALDKAHKQGIVHRDLKPGNVMLTKSGAKLLDFGLAKLASASPSSLASELSALPTVDRPLTEQGTLLGTLQYMAPEQLEGKEADARTDIFALGVLLHEMATGQRAFSGKSRASLIAAILDAEPPTVSSVQPMAPAALDHVVRTCLAKDPDERWQTAHDVMAELKWIADAGSQAGALVEAAGKRSARKLWAWVTGAALAALAIGVALGWRFGGADPGPSPRLRLTLTFPPEAPLPYVNGIDSALSPDGRRLVYVGGSPSVRRLYVREMDGTLARALDGSDGAESPFFSPDGAWVGFFAGGKLKKTHLGGGAPFVLCDAPSGRGGSWGEDDTIVFAPTLSSGLFRVRAGGGTPEEVTKLDKGEGSHRWPQLLPGARAAVFTVGVATTWGEARIESVSLKTRERKRLLEGGTSPRYVPTGHLVFGRVASLLAVRFDVDRLEVEGSPVPILEGIETLNNTTGAAKFTFSAGGVFAYLPAASTQQALTWVTRSGVAQPTGAPERAYAGDVALSPRGDRAAVTIREAGRGDIWVYDLARRTLGRITFDGDNMFPVWAPDGQRVAFATLRPGEPDAIWVKSPESGAPPEKVMTTTEFGGLTPSSWSPDRRTLAIVLKSPTTAYDVWMLPLEGERTPTPFVQTPFNDSSASFAPGGRFLAFDSNESGRSEVYVQAYPGPGGKWQVSTEGGDFPIWARSGRELFYRSGDKLMAVDVQTAPEFRTSAPRVLFESRFFGYAVAPDGRFLVVKPIAQDTGPAQLQVVVGWFDELREKLGAAPKRP